MQKFHSVAPVERDSVDAAFKSEDAEKICNALVSITFYEADWGWAQDKCLQFLGDSDYRICGLAATCLGHLARIHRRLDKERVVVALRERAVSCPQISGRIQDALDDIDMFAV